MNVNTDKKSNRRLLIALLLAVFVIAAIIVIFSAIPSLRALVFERKEPSPVFADIAAPEPIGGEPVEFEFDDYIIKDNLFIVQNGGESQAFELINGQLESAAVKTFSGTFNYEDYSVNFRFDYVLTENSFTYFDDGYENPFTIDLLLLDREHSTCVINILYVTAGDERIPVFNAYILNLSSGEMREIAQPDETKGAPGTIWAIAEEVSPDGKKILYYTNRETYQEDRAYSYYVFNLDTGCESLITIPEEFMDDPDKTWLIKKPESIWWSDDDSVIFDYIFKYYNETAEQKTDHMQYVKYSVSQGKSEIVESSLIQVEHKDSTIYSPIRECEFAIRSDGHNYVFLNRLTGELFKLELTIDDNLNSEYQRVVGSFDFFTLSVYEEDELPQQLILVDINGKKSYLIDKTNLENGMAVGYIAYYINGCFVYTIIDNNYGESVYAVIPPR